MQFLFVESSHLILFYFWDPTFGIVLFIFFYSSSSPSAKLYNYEREPENSWKEEVQDLRCLIMIYMIDYLFKLKTLNHVKCVMV